MDIQFILDTLRAVKLELYRRRVAAAIVFMLVTAAVLTVGYVTPKSYTSQAVLYADQSNILQPLLRGQAEVTQLDRINEARELIQSRSFLELVALDTGLISELDSDQKRNTVISALAQDGEAAGLEPEFPGAQLHQPGPGPVVPGVEYCT